jgi:predicted transposase YbfD/YdcC
MEKAAMVQKEMSLASHLACIPDPRKIRGQRHLFIEILLIAILAELCGADSWEDIHRFAVNQKAWLKTFLSLPGGIPSSDTFNRLFYLIDPKAFGECFLAWIRDIREKVPGDIVALDGKTLRASLATGKPALHVVSAWSTANHLVLGQRAVDEKSNEITAIPELLKVLDLKGCIITIDAMGCQKDIAKGIVAKKADYILAVKANQEKLHKAIQGIFEAVDSQSAEISPCFSESLETSRGRNAVRRVSTVDGVKHLPEDILFSWPKLETVVRVQSESQRGGKTVCEERFYISTLQKNKVELIAHGVRSHWGIENKLHWTLDVAFQEDKNRTRKGNGPECSAIMRHIVLNLLKQDKTPNRTMKFKRMLAAMSPDYRLAALLGFPQFTTSESLA